MYIILMYIIYITLITILIYYVSPVSGIVQKISFRVSLLAKHNV